MRSVESFMDEMLFRAIETKSGISRTPIGQALYPIIKIKNWSPFKENDEANQSAANDAVLKLCAAGLFRESGTNWYEPTTKAFQRHEELKKAGYEPPEES